MERRLNPKKRERFENIRLEVAARLQRVCSHLPDLELRELTARIARVRLRYEAVTAVPERVRITS